MADEQQQLDLVVRMVDQATPQLMRLRAEMQQLGQLAGNEQMTKLSRQLDQVGRQIRPIAEEMTRAERAGTALRHGIGLLSGTVIAAGYGFHEAGQKLREFSQKMIEFNNISRTTGFTAAQVKGVVDQMAQFGISGQAAISNITNFATALADLGRRGSELRERLMTHARGDPQAMTEFIQRMLGFRDQNDLVGAMNELVAAADAAFANAIKRGLPELEAADIRKRFLAEFKLTPEMLSIIERLQGITKEQEAALKRQIELAQQFTKEWEKMNTAVSAVYRGIQTEMLGPMAEMTTLINEQGEAWGRAIGAEVKATVHDIKEIFEFFQGFYRLLQQVPTQWGKLFGRGEAPAGGGGLASDLGINDIGGAGGGGGAAVPQNFMGGGAGGGAAGFIPDPNYLPNSPVSTNIEDRRGDLLETNTSQMHELVVELRRLNDSLLGAPSGGGGLGLLSTQMGGLGGGLGSGGGVASPMGRLPGLGGGGGGGGGGRAPYGSDVGPGTAPGAGATPAGPGGTSGPGPASGPGGIGTQAGPAARAATPTLTPYGGAAGIPGLPGTQAGPAAAQPSGGFNAAGVQGLPGSPSGPAVRREGGGGGGVAGGAPTYGLQDRSNKSIPASIRYNNPGAQWPSAESKRFGQTDVGIIGGGNQIAGFPTPVHGLASNIALLQRRYVGKTIGAAIHEWSGGGRSSVPGFNSGQILTPEIARDPAFWQAMNAAESGRRGGLSEQQIRQALDMVQAGSAAAYEAANPEFARLARRGGGVPQGGGGGAPGGGISATGASLIQQAQAGAGTRKGPIDPRLEDALQYAAEQTGLKVRVTSGGQPLKGSGQPWGAATGRTGSLRHDLGRAADFDLLDADGKILAHDDPRRLAFMEAAATAGAGGAGASYMSDPRKIHMGITGAGGRVGEGLGAYAGTPAERAAIERGVARSQGFDRAQLGAWRKRQEGGAVAVSDEDRMKAYGRFGVGREAIDRAELDKAASQSVAVKGNGKITVDVNAPKGTTTDKADLYKKTEVTRQTSMEKAEDGPKTTETIENNEE